MKKLTYTMKRSFSDQEWASICSLVKDYAASYEGKGYISLGDSIKLYDQDDNKILELTMSKGSANVDIEDSSTFSAAQRILDFASTVAPKTVNYLSLDSGSGLNSENGSQIVFVEEEESTETPEWTEFELYDYDEEGATENNEDKEIPKDYKENP